MHKFHISILRLNDIRGIVGRTLFVKDAYVLGKCFGTMIRDQGGIRICVGYDGRFSSPDLENFLVFGLISCGIKVIRINCVPTPMIYFAERFLQVDASIMVTGSHNSSEYNGFKISLSGHSLFEQDIQVFEKILENGLFANGTGSLQTVSIFYDYKKYVLDDFFAYYFKGKHLKVVWDCGNGAVGIIIKELIIQLPGEHFLLNQEIDGNFPAHHPDPTIKENLEQLIQTVRFKKYDLGLAFDGDGDRIGVVDEDGTIILGDQLLIFYAEEVLKILSKAPIICDIKASQIFFNEIIRLGGVPVMWRTGHSLIKKKMNELNSPLAGEMSGHFFFSDRYMGFDDSIYAALRLIGGISIKKNSLKEWNKGFLKMISTPEIRLKCPDNRKFQVIKEVERRICSNNFKYINIDGIRVLYKNGWWLLRASNTENVLVIRIEAVNKELLVHLKTELMKQLIKSKIKVFL